MIPDAELAKVFAVPLRRRLFELVERSTSPVSLGELTAALGCNYNTVRLHLARLRDAGLVEEHVESRSQRGRPRLLYTARARPDPYARLARMLLELARGDDRPRAVGHRAGRHDAELWRGGDAVDALETETARLGFAPRRVEHAGGVDLVLDTCPIADVADADPRTVCALHRGLVEGLVEGVGGARVRAFLVPDDPHAAGCVVRIQRGPRPRLE
jgi:predicted ArsR family transcriptional regulator